jgi:hypothetical protein
MSFSESSSCNQNFGVNTTMQYPAFPDAPPSLRMPQADVGGLLGRVGEGLDIRLRTTLLLSIVSNKV